MIHGFCDYRDGKVDMTRRTTRFGVLVGKCCRECLQVGRFIHLPQLALCDQGGLGPGNPRCFSPCVALQVSLVCVCVCVFLGRGGLPGLSEAFHGPTFFRNAVTLKAEPKRGCFNKSLGWR